MTRAMDEDIIKRKIQKAIELICQLYKDELITDAYIVGSVANGSARKESDIDILLIHPSFEERSELGPENVESITKSQYLNEEEKRKFIKRLMMNINLSNKLIEIGAEFKQLTLKDAEFWYQLYNDELFHIMTIPYVGTLEEEPHIEITKDLC